MLNIANKIKNNIAAIVLFTLATHIAAMTVFAVSKLHGNMDHHVLPSKMFGVPEALQRKGFDVFYTDPKKSGWDGQFYFYIANDPFALRDTQQHLDAPAYRYQRIGFPLIAWSLSKLTLQDWVSPKLYYLTNLALVVIATFFAARYLQARGFAPAWILVWAISGGTLFTVMAGLTDAAADALLIVALIGALQERRWLYMSAATFAALSRELYVLFPCAIAICQLYSVWHSSRSKKKANIYSWLRSSAWVSAVPVIVFIAWQYWIRNHFGLMAADQAFGVLGWPMQAWVMHFWSALNGRHPHAAAGLPSYREAIMLLLFLGLLAVAMYSSWRLIRDSQDSVSLRGLGLAMLAFTLLYTCLGNIVMQNFTGYTKAVSFLLFAIPFARLCNTGFVSRRIVVLLALMVVLPQIFAWLNRDAANQTTQISTARAIQLVDLNAADPNADF